MRMRAPRLIPGVTPVLLAAACGGPPLADPVPFIRAAMEAQAEYAEAHEAIYVALAESGPDLAPPGEQWAQHLYLGPAPARSYALFVVPLDATRKDARLYCADQTGTIRATPENQLPVLVDGRCPGEWSALEKEPKQ